MLKSSICIAVSGDIKYVYEYEGRKEEREQESGVSAKLRDGLEWKHTDTHILYVSWLASLRLMYSKVI